jgi:hypothetical protein
MVMTYNGGDCSQSFNVQGEQGLFECFDVGDNGEDKNRTGAPTIDGTFSYIKVTALGDEGVIYHEDWVQVGTQYNLTLPDGEDKVVANMNITIYNTNITLPAFQLQNLRYHSSCSSNLFLKDVFGASQLVEWENAQGIITCFAVAEFTFDLEIPIDIEGDNITLTSGISVTNFGIFNLTDQVAGMTLTPGATLSLSFNYSIDLTTRMRYTGLTTITGVTDEGVEGAGVECRGIDFFTFFAGNELPATYPSLAPTQAPSVTPGPTPNPLEAACELDADIVCILGDGANCTGLGPPLNTLCVGENPTQLRFIYNGLSCAASNTTGQNFDCSVSNGGVNGQSAVYISVADRDDFPYFNGVVPLFGLFAAEGPGVEINDRFEIRISTVNPITGQPDQELQFIEMRGTCQEGQDDISLLTQYGALQLASFTSPGQGTNSAINDIIVTYSVENVGKLTAIAESLFRMSNLQGARTFLSPPGVQLGRGISRSFQDISRLNMFSSAGATFETVLTATGVGMMSGTPCDSIDSFTLSINP